VATRSPAADIVVETDPEAMRRRVLAVAANGTQVGFVPTMGALHAGHESLVRRAASECGAVAVSIFVNPTQFGPREDFARYPRPFEADLERLRAGRVDWVFVPSADAIYPPGDATRIHVAGPAERWEGAFRPGHFDGVATVVAKLFAIVPAATAYFGEKDWQQCAVIRRMVADLMLPVRIVVCPTVREPDGLAMSSRNAYLSPEDRRRAAAIPASLERAAGAWVRGDAAAHIEEEARGWLSEAGFTVDYWRIVCEESLEPIDEAASGGAPRILVACRLGVTRLIDNRGLARR
jgi:pantoate--beta-alanine ligase